MKPLNQKAERVLAAAAEDKMDEVRAMQTVTAGCATTLDPGWLLVLLRRVGSTLLPFAALF